MVPTIDFRSARDELAELFSLADDIAAAVSTYRDLGRVLVDNDVWRFYRLDG